MDREDSLFYIAAGPFVAILLGAALTPLRGLTPASNLAFAFVAVTIVVAELGGSVAGLATAAASALSLDFFLTQPYLRLSMEDKHDVIAFVGLGVCGLIAAALGAHRERRLAAVSDAARHGELLHSLLRDWDPAGTLETQLARILVAVPNTYPLTAAVVRDTSDRVIASGSPPDGLRPIPRDLLDPERVTSLGPEGDRIALVAGEKQVGWLDVWGDDRPVSAASRRALPDLARLLALRLAADAQQRTSGT
jgi:uncharacterized protein DUF4118